MNCVTAWLLDSSTDAALNSSNPLRENLLLTFADFCPNARNACLSFSFTNILSYSSAQLLLSIYPLSQLSSDFFNWKFAHLLIFWWILAICSFTNSEKVATSRRKVHLEFIPCITSPKQSPLPDRFPHYRNTVKKIVHSILRHETITSSSITKLHNKVNDFEDKSYLQSVWVIFLMF
jgi:hypothetical protein